MVTITLADGKVIKAKNPAELAELAKMFSPAGTVPAVNTTTPKGKVEAKKLEKGECEIIKADKHGARLVRRMSNTGNIGMVVLPGLKGYSVNGEIGLTIADGKTLKQTQEDILRACQSVVDLLKS